MQANDFTVLVGLDARTFQQFQATFPINVHVYPGLKECHWRFFYDSRGDKKQDPGPVIELFNRYGIFSVGLPWATVTDYPSQREKMLTGFVIQSHHVASKYWIKIDTDAFIEPDLAAVLFAEQSWFDNDPAYIAPSWGYTVGSDQPHKLDNWGDQANRFEHPRLDIPFNPKARTVKHKRMCSWVSIYETRWTQHCAILLDGTTLPIPSQDTFHWYCAERQRQHVKHVNFKKRGWRNISSTRRLIDHTNAIKERILNSVSVHDPR